MGLLAVILLAVLGACAASPTATAPAGAVADSDQLTRGRQVFAETGCPTCHILGEFSSGVLGTDLHGIGSRYDVEYIHTAIVAPNTHIAEQCLSGPCMPNLMPQDYESMLSADDLAALVAFLAAQR